MSAWATGDRNQTAAARARESLIRHQGLVRRHKMSYLLISVSVCQVDTFDGPRGFTSPCLHHSSVNCLASGWATSLITACTAMTSIVPRCSGKPCATAGLHLENDLADSAYWSTMPLHQRAIVLLFLVDRGLVDANGPQRPAHFRAASSRRVLGGKTTILATRTTSPRSSSCPLFATN